MQTQAHAQLAQRVSETESETDLEREEARQNKRRKRKRDSSISSTDGEIKNDEDALSIMCSDDEFLKDVDAELDDNEYTADAVARAPATVVDKSFANKRNDDKLKEKLTG